MGIDWWNGNAIWLLMNTYGSDEIKKIGLMLTAFPFIFKIAGWSVMIIELFYPILILFKRSQKSTLIFIIAIHLIIALFLELYFFSAIMILFNLIAFGKVFKIDIWYDQIWSRMSIRMKSGKLENI